MNKVYVGLLNERSVRWFFYAEEAYRWLEESSGEERKLVEFEGVEIVLDSDGKILRFE